MTGRPRGARAVDWDSVIRQARKAEGLWIIPLELVAVSMRTVKVIRQRERRQLRMDDGVLRCRIKTGITIGNVTTVTLAVKFEKKGQPPC